MSLQMQHPLEKNCQYGMSTVNHSDLPCRSDGTALHFNFHFKSLNNTVDLAKSIHGKIVFSSVDTHEILQ